MSTTRTDTKPNNFMRQIKDDDSKYYTTLEELGRGTFGRVYRVQYKQNGQMMACKLQKVQGSYQEWATKRELDVWRTAARGSKYVVQVYDASYNEQTRDVRIYTELLEGGDLAKLLANIYKSGKQIHPLIIYHLAWQTANALSDIQKRHILHRDIKTDNVLMTMKITPEMNRALWKLTERKSLDAAAAQHLLNHLNMLASKDDRLCVLTDFGLSRDQTVQERSTITMGEDARWTVGTSAPELFFYNYQSPLADVYSVGVLINMLCTAQLPPPAGNPFPRLPSCYDAELQKLVDECLSWDLRQRPTAGDMSERLNILRLKEGSKLFAAQQQFKQYQEWYAGELKRLEDIKRQARERDQAGADVWRQSIAGWDALMKQHREQEAKQLPARPNAQYTKAERAAFLAQSKKGVPPQPAAAAPAPAPAPDSLQEAAQAYSEAKRRYEEALRKQQQKQAAAAAA
ncbi:kinase-like domain-containing protein, partial [Achaetomium macrosporum]